MSSKCRINLSGIVVSKFNQRCIDNIMQKLINKSPSDSLLRLCIENGKSRINGSLSITSLSRKFESKQEGDNPLEVVKKLSKDLQFQIRVWKTERVF